MSSGFRIEKRRQVNLHLQASHSQFADGAMPPGKLVKTLCMTVFLEDDGKAPLKLIARVTET
jgi:hypothetical protein